MLNIAWFTIGQTAEKAENNEAYTAVQIDMNYEPFDIFACNSSNFNRVFPSVWLC